MPRTRLRENRLVLRRIHDAGGLTRSAFRAAYDAETGRLRAASDGSGGDFYLTLGARVGRRFARAIVTSILEEAHVVHRVLPPARVPKDDDLQSTGRPSGYRLPMTYLLDADVLVWAKNQHYGLDFCPAFSDYRGGDYGAGPCGGC